MCQIRSKLTLLKKQSLVQYLAEIANKTNNKFTVFNTSYRGAAKIFYLISSINKT